MIKGFFITFEGVDGCGKSTQWQAVGDALKVKHPEREIILTRNPGGTAVGKDIRQLLLTPRNENDANISAMAELMLYMADRAQHVDEVVRPALERGAIVLCDRFVDSSVAYQGAARGLDSSLIMGLNSMACGDIEPHLTLLYDTDIDLLSKRIDARGERDRIELEGLEFQKKVQEGFRNLYHKNKNRIYCLDASRSIQELTKDSIEIIENTLSPHHIESIFKDFIVIKHYRQNLRREWLNSYIEEPAKDCLQQSNRLDSSDEESPIPLSISS